MIRQFLGGFFALQLVAVSVVHAASLPKGTSFIGFQDGMWNVYLVMDENSSPQMVTTVSEPRAATFSFKKNAVAYVAADGKIREVSLNNNDDRVLLEPDRKRAFAQPSYNADGSKLLLVDMKDGTSADTEIALFDRASTGGAKQVTTQPASQFEPHFCSEQSMVYSSVSCVLGCGKIIQEIWRKNITAETAEQITLMNAIARQPVPSPDGRWVYFSSNKAGNYHIWRVPFSGGNPEQVTKGNVTDVNPAVGHDNRVCFIRVLSTGSNMVCRLPGGDEDFVDLPTGIQNIRNLEISSW